MNIRSANHIKLIFVKGLPFLLLYCLLWSHPVTVSAEPLVGTDEESSESNYVLRAGDKIKLTIYPEDEYIKGGETEISTEGNVTIPVVGKVNILDKTLTEAQKAIAKELEAGYFVDPEVVIEVIKFKDMNVVVLGQVKRPGTYPFPPGKNRFTLLEAISLAGGFSDIANVKKIQIVRIGNQGKSQVSANADDIIKGKDQDIELRQGDVIHVPESFF